MTGHQMSDPGTLRVMAHERQGMRCARCWEVLDSAWELHHRQRRNILGWCACNVVALHARCHTQGPLAVHDHPDQARELGLIVATTEDPREVLLSVQWPWDGAVLLDCEGLAVSNLP